MNIGIAYDADIDKAKAIIVDVARQMDWIADPPAPKVVVRNFSESAVDLQLRVWISDARRRMDTISFVIDRVKEAFDRAGIEIPYPKRDIHVRYTDFPAQTAHLRRLTSCAGSGVRNGSTREKIFKLDSVAKNSYRLRLFYTIAVGFGP